MVIVEVEVVSAAAAAVFRVPVVAAAVGVVVVSTAKRTSPRELQKKNWFVSWLLLVNDKTKDAQ